MHKTRTKRGRVVITGEGHVDVDLCYLHPPAKTDGTQAAPQPEPARPILVGTILGGNDPQPAPAAPAAQREQNTTNTVIQYIPLAEIVDNPWRARENYGTPAELIEMMQSIKQHGLVQYPTGRRRQDGQVELADGHRRLAAYRALAEKHAATVSAHVYTAMPVVISVIPDHVMAATVLEANARRKDLNAIEQARAYQRYLKDFPVTQSQLARRLGIAQPTLANLLRLLELPDQAQQLVISGGITASHARELLAIKDRPEMLQKVAAGLAQHPAAAGPTTKELATQILEEQWKHVETMDSTPFEQCAACEHHIKLRSRWNNSKVDVCAQPDHLRELRQARAAQRSAEALAAAGETGVLDLSQRTYHDYRAISDPAQDRYAQLTPDMWQECQSCEHRKAGRHYAGGHLQQVCLKPQHYKERMAAWRQKAIQEQAARQAALNERLVHCCPVAVLPPAIYRALIAVLGWTARKEIAEQLGIETETGHWEPKLDKAVSGLNAGDLHRYFLEGIALHVCTGAKGQDHLDALVAEVEQECARR